MRFRLLASTPLVLTLLGCAEAPETEPPPEPTAPASAVPAPVPPHVAALEARLALATADGFYLLLDPAAPALTLLYRGAALQSWPVRQIAIGRPRVAFAHLPGSPAWHSVVWTGGVLTPARPVEERQIEPPAPGEEPTEIALAVVPPTAEESIPVPSRYRIRFHEGLALEIRRAGPASGWLARQRAGVVARLQDVGSVLRPSSRDGLRVRVVLDAATADDLYRALPPDTSLLILPPPEGD